jgi:hypothetical protein
MGDIPTAPFYPAEDYHQDTITSSPSIIVSTGEVRGGMVLSLSTGGIMMDRRSLSLIVLNRTKISRRRRRLPKKDPNRLTIS